MKLVHVALAARSEEHADTFYGRILGLEKGVPKTLPRELVQAVFGLDQELTVINYTGEDILFEVFLGLQAPSGPPRVDHVCLQAPDLEAFLEKCREHQAPVNRVPKGE
ncbi:MAG: hypothetical protein AB1896_02415, partial [Thermodesulfobacteriota bacterium]